MARESREVWEKRVGRWRDSGLSAREFAAEIGVNAQTLAHWAWQLGRGEPRRASSASPRRRPRTIAPVAAPPSPVAWLEVVADEGGDRREGVASTPALELVLRADRMIRVPVGFDAESLRRLIAVVEGR